MHQLRIRSYYNGGIGEIKIYVTLMLTYLRQVTLQVLLVPFNTFHVVGSSLIKPFRLPNLEKEKQY